MTYVIHDPSLIRLLFLFFAPAGPLAYFGASIQLKNLAAHLHTLTRLSIHVVNEATATFLNTWREDVQVSFGVQRPYAMALLSAFIFPSTHSFKDSLSANEMRHRS